MSTPTINVKIRTDLGDDPVPLCTWPTDRLDELMPAIGRWGIYSDVGTYGTSDLSGQIVVDGTEAYFEIIINVEDQENA